MNLIRRDKDMKEGQLVYLVRHGQTEWATTMRHTGRTDIPLTDAGRQEAAVLQPVFQDIDFDLVLSSPLQRAFETCRIAGLADRAQTTADLMEWDYGDYEGKTTVEIRKHVPDWTVFTHSCPGGETIGQVAARADHVIAEIRQVDGPAAVFAHGHLLRVLGARWLDLEPHHGRFFALGTGTLSVLGYDRGNTVIQTWNGPLLTAACALSHIAQESDINKETAP
jgi:broad specificity phosphatase PhoE